MVSTWVSDAGSVSRKTRDPWVTDSGGTERKVKKIWVADSGGVSRLVFRSGGTDVLAMVAGGPVDGTNGYDNGAFGTLTPTVMGDGATVTQLNSSNTTPFPMIFAIVGYAGTITSSYLTSLTINSTTFLSTAATFGGGSLGGVAQWSWASGVRFSTGLGYTVTTVRA